MAIKQITLRNPSADLVDRLRDLARQQDKSLNATILGLLEEALGIDGRRERLSRYATWSEDEAARFDEALSAQRALDGELWK